MTSSCFCSHSIKPDLVRVYKSQGNLGLNVPDKAAQRLPSCSTLQFFFYLPTSVSDLTLFTAFQMLEPPKYSVVLSLDKSIRQHIGFLLKATDCAACIDSSVRQLRLHAREAHPHSQGPWCARSFIFQRFTCQRTILKLRQGVKPQIQLCNNKE